MLPSACIPAETNCVHYIDDGYSVGSFDRPGWKRLMDDIEAGTVQTGIAKDASIKK